MTKKLIGMLLALSMTAFLGACGGGTTPTESPAGSPAASPSP